MKEIVKCEMCFGVGFVVICVIIILAIYLIPWPTDPSKSITYQESTVQTWRVDVEAVRGRFQYWQTQDSTVTRLDSIRVVLTDGKLMYIRFVEPGGQEKAQISP